MNPFPPEEDMTVWVATNTNNRKVQEIRNDPRVCLYYADHSKATGYVALSGNAVHSTPWRASFLMFQPAG
jgi:general stress protein 26